MASDIKSPVVPAVGMGATEFVGSDRYAYTIIAVPTPRKIVVQRDHAQRTDTNGLSEIQRYSYHANPAGGTYIVTLRKNGRWVVTGEPARGGRGFGIGFRKQYFDPSF